MTFQSTVSLSQGFGVPGELFTNSPSRAQSFTLYSAGQTHVIGAKAYTIISQGLATPGGTGVFAGVLANPKVAPLQGTSVGGSLAPTLVLANYAQADIVSMGTMTVTLVTTLASPGWPVIYNNTTGLLTAIPIGDPLPVGSTFANAVVDYFSFDAGNLAVITLSPYLIAPVLA